MYIFHLFTGDIIRTNDDVVTTNVKGTVNGIFNFCYPAVCIGGYTGTCWCCVRNLKCWTSHAACNRHCG